MTTRYADSEIIGMWLERQRSPLTRDCYRRDANRLLGHARKVLRAIDLATLQTFSQSLEAEGLAPLSLTFLCQSATSIRLG